MAEPHRSLPWPDPAQVKKRWEPKKLSQKHKTALTLYAQGLPLHQIHSVTGVSQVSMDLLVLSPLGKQYMGQLEAILDQRLRSLYGASVDAIQDQLTNGSGADKLKAAGLQLKATGKLGGAADAGESAEDVVQRIMNTQINGDVHIHVEKEDAG